MSKFVKILELADKLSTRADEIPTKELDALETAANAIGRAWSGSWLGYQSRVYYNDLKPVPPGARFSKEWGMKRPFANDGSIGEWSEYDFEQLVAKIKDMAGIQDINQLENQAEKIGDLFEDAQAELLSLLTPIVENHQSDNYLADLFKKIKDERILLYNDFIQAFQPNGQIISRDILAIEGGLETPAHFSVLAKMGAIKLPYMSCSKLSKWARRAASHCENLVTKEITSGRIGTNVFIGHGRSLAWRDLKDFVQDRLRLPWDEFNRVPIAGFTNIARLSEMLNNAAVAFIVLTAEDEQVDGKLHARMNVIHEAGLFQGRLGFERAILMLEEGCEEFSNVQGLGQIRFPVGNISAKFEEVRRVIEREGLSE